MPEARVVAAPPPPELAPPPEELPPDQPLPALAITSERLTEDEQKVIHESASNGCGTALPLRGEWALTEIVVIGNDLRDVYTSKPRATVRALLKVIESGTSREATCAAAYIAGLVDNVAHGALYVYHQIHGEHSRRELLRTMMKMIAEKEAGGNQNDTNEWRKLAVPIGH
jgi:hypothetical protein